MDRAARAIEQWKRERPDLDVSPMAVLGRLNEASSLIARERLAPLFARFGLQAGEFDVLATLRRSGQPYALTPTALYEATMVTSGAMTNRLDRLEKAGLILRGPHPSDRRGIVVQLTGKGPRLDRRGPDRPCRQRARNPRRPVWAERETLAHLLAKLIGSLS